MAKPLIIIIPYFGRWPFWIDLFFASCRSNPKVDWLIYTDCAIPKLAADNVTFVSISFDDYKARVSKALEINFCPDDPYKLCDLKPALGYVHQDEIQAYDFFAFGDVDIVYGDLLNYFAQAMQQYQCISTHDTRISGHLCLLKNNQLMRNAFKQVKGWEALLEDKNHRRFDEKQFSKVFLQHKNLPMFLRKMIFSGNPYMMSVLFRETYSTSYCRVPWLDGSFNFPCEWQWHNGSLTNNLTGAKQFPYLHFLHWKQFWPKQSDLEVNFVDDNRLVWTINESGFRASAD